MKLTNYQIDSIWTALTSLGQEPGIPLRMSFKFVKVKQAIKPLFEALDEIRQQAAKKHAGDQGKFDPNSKELRAYIEELQPILLEEQEVDFEKISESEFMELEINLSPVNAEALLLVLDSPSNK